MYNSPPYLTFSLPILTSADDNCYSDAGEGYPDAAYEPDVSPRAHYVNMSDAVLATHRAIVFQICEWGVDFPSAWAPPLGNSWRITNDIIPFNYSSDLESSGPANIICGSWALVRFGYVGGGEQCLYNAGRTNTFFDVGDYQESISHWWCIEGHVHQHQPSFSGHFKECRCYQL
jgi:hypothetical protein